MFGTVARMKVKPGKEQQLTALPEQWEQEIATGAIGTEMIAEYVFRLENAENEFIMVAIFKDRESYFANAQKSETDRQYRQLRELLEADPEWNDGEIVHAASFATVGI